MNHLIERLSHFSGFNPFFPTWKLDRHRKFHLFLIFLAIISSFYSTYVAENGVDIIKRSFSLGIFTQTLMKAFLILYNANIYQQLIVDIETLYRSKNKKTMAIMEKAVGKAKMIYNVITFVNSSAVIIFCLFPFIAIFILEQLNLMFPFFLPFVDPHSYPGYIVNSFFHTILIIYTLLFHNAFDIAFACFTIHATAIIDLIKLDFDELGEFAEKCEADNELDMKYVGQKLKEIIKAENEFDRYVEKMNKFYVWPCFFTSSTSIFSICIALVLIIIIRWPLAYGLCWALLGQIFAAYVNGEIVSHQV